MYKVIRTFVDLQDNKYRYNAGDTYPRKGKRPTKKRIAELMGSENRRREPLIAEVVEE